MLQLGPGVLVAVPASGDLPTNPTPVKFNVVQDFSIEFSRTIKEAFGEYLYPVDTGITEGKVSGKVTLLQHDINMLNQIIFSDSFAAGQWLMADEVDLIPATTPFTLTVLNSTTFTADGGVIFSATGQRLTPVAINPTTGQYTVSAGVYTFASADEAKSVSIKYYYTATTGNTLTINNQLIGYGPVITLHYNPSYQEKSVWTVFSVRFGKMSQSIKRGDYMTVEVDFEAFANAAGQVARICQGTPSL